MNDKPNLFLVGAAKSGTTSLYTYLEQHPDIFAPSNEDGYFGKISTKEPKFFSSRYHMYPHAGEGDIGAVDARTVKTVEKYRNLYSMNKGQKYLMDGSVDYLYYSGTAKDIYEFNNDSKIIILLRNPVERAYSAYMSLRRDFRESVDFHEALLLEEERIKKNYEFLWAYKGCGLYYRQVKAFLDVFGNDNVLVLMNEDLRSNPKALLKKVCIFLDIYEAAFKNTNVLHNKSGIPKKNAKTYTYLLYKRILRKYAPAIMKIIPQAKARRYSKALKRMLILNNVEKTKMDYDSERYLYGYFRNDIELLEGLLNRDLEHWKRNY